MFESAGDACFGQEASAQDGVLSTLGSQFLEGDFAIEVGVARHPYPTDAARGV